MLLDTNQAGCWIVVEGAITTLTQRLRVCGSIAPNLRVSSRSTANPSSCWGDRTEAPKYNYCYISKIP